MLLKVFITALLSTAVSSAVVTISDVRASASHVFIEFRASDLASCSVTIWNIRAALPVHGPAPCLQPGPPPVDNKVKFLLRSRGLQQNGERPVQLAPYQSYRFTIRSGSDFASGTFQMKDAAVTGSFKPVPTAYTPVVGPLLGCWAVPGYPAPALCEALPTDLPIGTFPVPGIGGTYIDGNFGSTVRILTGPDSNYHGYSSPSALSTSARYAYVTIEGYNSTIVDVATGSHVRQSLRQDRTWSNGEYVWDTKRDDTLYYFSGYWNGEKFIQEKLMKFNVLSGQETEVRDFTNPPLNLTNVTRGGTGEMSADGWLQFYSEESQQVCVVQVARGDTVCASYANAGGLGWDYVDFVSISKGADRSTKKHYVIIQGGPANAVFEFDSVRKTLTFLFRGPEIAGNGDGVCQAGETCLIQSHSDTMEDSNGKQYLVRTMESQAECAFYLTTLDLSKGTNMLKAVSEGGGRTEVAKVGQCSSTRWPDVHVGCSRGSPYCTISLENIPVLEPPPPAIRDGAPYNGEIWVLRENGAEIRRVAMHRSVIQEYYDQPRVCISDNGRRVLWDTNFGLYRTTTESPWRQRVVTANTGF